MSVSQVAFVGLRLSAPENYELLADDLGLNGDQYRAGPFPARLRELRRAGRERTTVLAHELASGLGLMRGRK
jgi:hypothetical protein